MSANYRHNGNGGIGDKNIPIISHDNSGGRKSFGSRGVYENVEGILAKLRGDNTPEPKPVIIKKSPVVVEESTKEYEAIIAKRQEQERRKPQFIMGVLTSFHQAIDGLKKDKNLKQILRQLRRYSDLELPPEHSALQISAGSLIRGIEDLLGREPMAAETNNKSPRNLADALESHIKVYIEVKRTLSDVASTEYMEAEKLPTRNKAHFNPEQEAVLFNRARDEMLKLNAMLNNTGLVDCYEKQQLVAAAYKNLSKTRVNPLSK